MKKVSVTVLVATLLMLSAVPATAGIPAAPVCGDVNDSGTVNTSDALAVLRKGVGQQVTLDCSGYEDQYSACQSALTTQNANLATCNDNLSSTNADLIECTTGAKCGDGVVNSVGEQCDDEDLGDTDCESLGYNAGTLHCDESCKFDTSGCDRCPEGSMLSNGKCWLLGANPLDGEGVGSCDTACASIGLECDEPSLQLIGQGGTNEACRAAADVARPDGAPHPISSEANIDVSQCGAATDYAFGCAVAIGLEPPEINGSIRYLFEGSVTKCEADYYGGPCGTPARRVCACNP
jgi:hypothetical protein